MKRKHILLAFTLLIAGTTWADNLPKDSLKVIDIEEVVVIATPKDTRKLREQPTSVTLLSQQDMQTNQVKSVKNLTGLVPNIFIPDYGSKLTSAIYIRGIGSRINTPSVGLYVDNIPYIDKSAFDFDYSDIERIDILRGPQGTLYGRNTMGGLLRIHTKSPFSYQGTDLRIGAATYNGYHVSLTHYHRLTHKFAFSSGGFYTHTGGFFKNEARNNERIDRSNAGGGRFRGIYLPSDNVKVDMTLNYEYSDQGGYPYYYTGMVNGKEEKRSEYIGKISYNERSSYYRGLLNAGVNIEYQAKNLILSAVTGYQNLKDRMFLDQDFTEQDIFNLEQKQKVNTLSEEITLKSKPGKRWEWTTGAFGFYQWLHTTGPVLFKEQGIKNVIEGNANNAFASGKGPTMHLTINNSSLGIGGDFDTPTLNGAFYHQSTFNDIFIKGLSLTAGLRLDYEKITMKYDSKSTPVDFDFSIKSSMGGMQLELTDKNMKAPVSFTGKQSTDYLQLLPKFALQYEWKKQNNVYATVARGYRSGGYNIQMFSDLSEKGMTRSMMEALKESPQFGKNERYGTMVIGMIDKMIPAEPDIKEYTLYKPEYSWNYEIGSHLTLCEGKLRADLAAFYMDIRDQQVARFAENGLGRITVNAGKSKSYGAEAALRAILTNALSFNTSYGYTYATFSQFETNKKNETGGIDQISYNGNYVPFVPKHTFNAGAQYIFFIAPKHWLDKVQLNANYTGAGRIYWTEQNNASQSFYSTLNGTLTLSKGNGSVAFWINNALNKDYTAFYFETLNQGFKQKGRPLQCGIELRCRF